MSVSSPTVAHRLALRLRLHPQPWLKLLVAGAALWGLAVLTLQVTNDQYVVPSVVILGSFVVPVAALMRLSERRRPVQLSSQMLRRLFVGGGVVGFLCSALLEAPLTSQPPAVFAGSVGLIEEVAKLAVLAWLTRRIRPKTAGAGFVAGAAVGFGFSAFETAGYALNAVSGGAGSWGALEGLQLLRAFITPATHGLWTAITGAVLWGAAGQGRYRVTGRLVAVVAGVVAIHGLWDLAPDLSRGLGVLLTGPHSSTRLLSLALPPTASSTTKAVTTILQAATLVLLSALGFTAAHFVRRRPLAFIGGSGLQPPEENPWLFVPGVATAGRSSDAA